MYQKTILVCMNDVDHTEQMMSVIKSLNARFETHIVGFYVVPAVQVYPGAGMQMSTQVYDGYRKYYLDHAATVKKQFNEMVRVEGMSAEWRQCDSETPTIADCVIEQGRMSDFIVLPQARKDNSGGIEVELTERVVMESGRPVLIIPSFGDFTSFGNKVLVAWNDTRESARAIFDANPFFHCADKIDITWFDAGKSDPDADLPGAELATVLARHDIDVVVEAIPAADIPVGEALLSHASDIGSDLLVMGAYGHSRMREFVFGGATKTILESMTLPVLMSH